MESQISSLFGGRIAEELIFGLDSVTTGASNDIELATEIARNMVTKWGLSEKMGPLAYSEDEGEVFLGRSITQHKNLADDTARVIDEEIRKVNDIANLSRQTVQIYVPYINVVRITYCYITAVVRDVCLLDLHTDTVS